MSSVRIVTVILCQLCLASHIFAAELAAPRDVQDLQMTARQYMDAKDYGSAQVQYKKILDGYPKTDYALSALHQMSVLNIKENNIEACKESVATLLREFPDKVETASAIVNIADCYFWDVKELSASRDLYQHMITKWPDHLDAIWAYRGLACSSICLGDFATAETAKDILLSNFSGHKDIAPVMTMIAGRYFWDAKKYSESHSLYQSIITNWPDHPELMKAYQGLACSSICLGDFATAETAKDKLLADYSDHKDIANSMKTLADCYFWNAQKYSDSRALYQFIITNWPDHAELMKAYQGLACCSICLGDFTTAEIAKDKLLADYSGHKDIANSIMRIADCYFWDAKKYSESRTLYERMIKDWPDHPDVIWAYQGLACSAIGLGDFTTVETVKNILLKDYSENQHTPDIMMRMANRYFFDAMKYSESRAIFQLVIDQWPDYPDLMGACQGLARCSVYLGDFTIAETSTDKLLSDFPDLTNDNKLIEYLNGIAVLYNERGEHQRAEELYQYVLDHAAPDNENVVIARSGMIASRIGKNQDSSLIQSQIDDVLLKYADSPKLAESIFMLGEQYYLRGRNSVNVNDAENAKTSLMNAIDIWRMNINRMNDSRHRCLAYYHTGHTYAKLDQYTQAVDCFQHVVNEWPQFDRAWNAQFMIIVSLDQLCQKGLISFSEAKARIVEANRILQEYYPNCKTKTVADEFAKAYSIDK